MTEKYTLFRLDIIKGSEGDMGGDIDWFPWIMGTLLVWTLSVLVISTAGWDYRSKILDFYVGWSSIILSVVAFIGLAFACTLVGGLQ